MAQTKLIGGGLASQGSPGVELGIDPTFLAARIALRPLDYAAKGNILGHYSVAQRSGEIAATLGAAAHLARVRWAPPDGKSFFVLMRLRMGLSISADVTSGKIEQAYKATIQRGWKTDFTANITSIDLATLPRTNAMRGLMGNSLMGAAGPGICTTAGGTGQAMTADAAPFAIATLPTLLLPTNSTGTAVLLTQGAAAPMATLYEYTSPSQHPVVLSNLEGISLQNVLAGYASGTFALYTQWEWAEVEVY